MERHGKIVPKFGYSIFFVRRVNSSWVTFVVYEQMLLCEYLESLGITIKHQKTKIEFFYKYVDKGVYRCYLKNTRVTDLGLLTELEVQKMRTMDVYKQLLFVVEKFRL